MEDNNTLETVKNKDVVENIIGTKDVYTVKVQEKKINIAQLVIFFLLVANILFTAYSYYDMRKRTDIVTVDSQSVLQYLFKVGETNKADMESKTKALEDIVKAYNGIVLEKGIVLNGDKFDKTSKLLAEGKLK